MANLKDIRDRIKSVKSIQKVTKAMKMVAAAKMRRAQENMEKARPYNHRLVEIIQHLLPSVERDMLPLLEVRDVKRVSYVVVTSDRGLAGSFNTSILRKAHNDIDDFGKENVDIFCIGKKANDYFKSRKYNIVGSYFDFWNELNFNQSMKIGSTIINHFLDQSVDEIRVVFNEFVNVAPPAVITEKLLRIELDEDELTNIDYLYEPSKKKIVKSLIPRYLNAQVWKYLLESYASAQAARMIAMTQATDNAKDIEKQKQKLFNKLRQEAITSELLDIIGGAEAIN